jgi:hypothetical protein
MEISLGLGWATGFATCDSVVGLAVATTGVDNTMRAEAGFSRHRSFRLFQQYPQIAVVPRRSGEAGHRSNSARQCSLPMRRNALTVSTWGTAVVPAFRTSAQGGPLGVTREQSAGAVVHEPPVAVAVAVHARPAAAVAPHEQLGAVGEPMVVAAGHGQPAALGKARER